MKSYKVREEIPKEAREELKEYSDLVANLLYYRGITDKELADEFFEIDYKKSLHDPFLLKDIDKAVDRILNAIKENERIAVFADYDADGIPGAVVLTDFFKKINYENYFVYIPHRNREGFGLNNKAIDKISEDGATLLITIDCGITDTEQVDHANELGINVIITDHHEENGHKPNAYAVVNPKQKTCKYPYKMLCGSGVVFKLVQALVQKTDHDIQEGWEKNLLDMVGIATMSDMVPLQGENRALANFGLTILKMSPRKGLHKLFAKTRTNQKELTEDDIGFTISPRINAASRMGEPETAFRMLSSNDEIEAAELVKHLHEINDSRKGHVAAMVKEINKHLEQDGVNFKVLVYGNPKWQPSLLGLAASKFVEELGKPVFLWGRGEGTEIKGSCRSISGVSVVDLMNGVGESVFETFGGHKEAGGFVLKKESVDFLNDELNKSFENVLNNSRQEPVWIDKTLSVDDINETLFSEVQKLSPFGVANPKPIFLVKNSLVDKAVEFGKTSEHFKITLKGNNKKIEAISFFASSNLKNIKEGDALSVIGHIERDFFNGRKLRLKIIDVI